MSKPSFSLNKPLQDKPLFMPTDNIVNGIIENVVNISANKIKHYNNHPFRLYVGERLNDMVESIKEYGVLSPLLVRPLPYSEFNGQFEYEVFVGHNRLEGGKLAGLTEVPCIIRVGLTDEEIKIIVRISNLLQRGFDDLLPSERAEALAIYYNSIKRQGKRTDLIKQVESLLNGNECDNFDNANNLKVNSATPLGNKSIEVVGEKYGLSRNSVARYIRLNNLIQGFKDFLDSEELSIRAGVSLSYIKEERQQTILNLTIQYKININMKQAERLNQLSQRNNSSANDEKFISDCTVILLNTIVKEPSPVKVIKFKLKRSAVESYFNEDDTEEVIQEKVLEALSFYYQHFEKHENTDN